MKLIKILWLFLGVLVIVGIYINEGSLSEAAIFLNLAMLYLSFPAGILVSLGHAILHNFFSVAIDTTMLSLTIEWSIYLMVGYFQWFRFVPWLVKKVRSYFFNRIKRS